MNKSLKYIIILIVFKALIIKNFDSCKLSNSHNGRDHLEHDNAIPREDLNWIEPQTLKTLGHISSVSISHINYLYVFHRGDRFEIPPFDTIFDENNITLYKTAIKSKTIIVIDLLSGIKIKSWGYDFFYFPHGITVDHNDCVWVTDIGRHQVMRYNPNSYHPNLIMGEYLIPGNDRHHFCKPSGVKVSSSNIVYVADGYCNVRIIRFSYSGEYMGEIPIPEGNLIHSVELIEEHDMVCAASRDNFRIFCYYAGLRNQKRFGEFIFSMGNLGNISQICYSGNDILLSIGMWFPSPSTHYSRGFSIHIPTKKVINMFGPEKSDEKFDIVHSMTVSLSDRSLYAAEFLVNATKRIYKFNI